MDWNEFIKSSPSIAAIVLIVWFFLKSQEKRDQAFLEAQTLRDKLFVDAINKNSESLAGVAGEVNKNTEALLVHTTEMRGAQTQILRAMQPTPKPRKIK